LWSQLQVSSIATKKIEQWATSALGPRTSGTDFRFSGRLRALLGFFWRGAFLSFSATRGKIENKLK
jgi:hypothetical protein